MTTATLTAVAAAMMVAEADEIIQDSPYAELVEESEIGPMGVVYTLTNGGAVVVTEFGDILEVEE